MSLALDTDVLVAWVMKGTPGHAAARALVRSEVSAGQDLAITRQVLWELVHVVTDPRRFAPALSMDEAIGAARGLWDAPEARRVVAGPRTVHRTLELLQTLGLGRKRILDTALAATLEEAAIPRLATFNRRHFEAFGFLEIVDP